MVINMSKGLIFVCQLVLFLVCNLLPWPSWDHFAVTFSRSRPVIGIAPKMYFVLSEDFKSLFGICFTFRENLTIISLYRITLRWIASATLFIYLPRLRVWQESKLFACAALQYALWSRRVVKSSRLTEHDPFHAGNQWRSRVDQPESARGKV